MTVRGPKRKAEAELSRVLAEMESGGFVDQTKVTVWEFLDRWLSHVATKTSAKTHERYAEIIRLGINPYLGAIRLSKLSPVSIQGAYADALRSGRKNGSGGLSPRTVLHHHRVFSQALKQAVRWQLISRNPADAVEPPRPVRREMLALDGDQTAELLQCAKPTALFLPVMLALTTGMRRGEILALRWSDVDLRRKTLSVNRTLEKSRNGGLAFKQPKTSKSRRVISLPDLTVDALKEQRVAQAELRLSLGLGWDEDGLVCCKGLGEPINPNTLTSSFAALVARSRVPRVRFHDLRHTHATQLLKEGIHPKIAQERLGHSTIAVTLDLYSHVLPGMQEDAAKKVDIALKTALGKRPEA